MRKKNGFTIVELITSFALVSVVLIFLFNIIFILKDIYTKNNNQTRLAIEQALLSRKLNEDFVEGSLISYNVITNGYQFVFSNDGLNKQYGCLTYDQNTKTINYKKTSNNNCTGNVISNYTYKLFANSKVNSPVITVTPITTDGVGTYNSILVVDLPIYSDAYKGTNFGVKVRYLYNNNIQSF